MDGMTYRTSSAMFLFYLFGANGHFHCFLTEFKELVYLRMLKLFEYDCRKVFSLSDGGILHLDFVGKRFVDEEFESHKPILFILPTLTGHS